MLKDTLQQLTNYQPSVTSMAPDATGWLGRMVEQWRLSLAARRAEAFGVDDELHDLTALPAASAREIGKPVWFG